MEEIDKLKAIDELFKTLGVKNCVLSISFDNQNFHDTCMGEIEDICYMVKRIDYLIFNLMQEKKDDE